MHTEADPVVAAINGIVKSNGVTISAASAGTDYLAPSGDGSNLTGVLHAEADTLDSVADRNATTNQSITTGGLTTAGTVQAEHLYTTDDLEVADDILLGSGSVMNWASNDITLTHASNTLTFAGMDSMSFGTANLTTTGVVGIKGAVNTAYAINVTQNGTFGALKFTDTLQNNGETITAIDATMTLASSFNVAHASRTAYFAKITPVANANSCNMYGMYVDISAGLGGGSNYYDIYRVQTCDTSNQTITAAYNAITFGASSGGGNFKGQHNVVNYNKATANYGYGQYHDVKLYTSDGGGFTGTMMYFDSTVATGNIGGSYVGVDLEGNFNSSYIGDASSNTAVYGLKWGFSGIYDNSNIQYYGVGITVNTMSPGTSPFYGGYFYLGSDAKGDVNNPTANRISVYAVNNCRGTDANLKNWAFYNGSTQTTPGKMFFGVDNIKTYWGTGLDLALYHNGTDSLIENITGKLILASPTTVEVGTGAAGVDYILQFNGETNDGVLTWMEDEDYFKFSDDVFIDDAENVVLGTTTGSKIGTATNQKLGFYNATPVTQQTGYAALKIDYTTGDLDSEAEVISALNTTNTALNAIRTALNNLGLTSTI